MMSYSPVVQGQTPVSLLISRVGWGTDLNNPTEAYPGDTGASLTVEVQNYSNETIKGIKATLMLSYPFSDRYGNHKLNATGTPTVVGNVMNQTGEVLPGGFFTLPFSMDIDTNASIQSYQYNMTVDYLLKSGSLFVKGDSKTLSVKLVVSKAPTTVTCSASPQRIEREESLDVTGSINPTRENVTITLLYKRPDGSTLNRIMKTAADSSYRDSYQPDLEGTWNINASWTGDARYKGNWASASFEVMYPVSLKIFTSDNRLVGGIDNPFNITLLNDGGASLSSIDATLTISSPLILRGDIHWTFNSLNPNSSILIPLSLYSPSNSIGSTFQGQIQLSYRDSYGQSHTDTRPLGLIIIGRTELVVYSKSVSPRSSSPGSKVVFTATILNKGNVKATYANASLLSNPVLELSDESTTYIGEIEENSPIPFTVSATVNSTTADGTYPVRILVFYRGDQYEDHSLNITMTLTVAKSQTGQSSQSNDGAIIAFLRDTGSTIAILAVASVSILILYKRRLSGGPQKLIHE